MTESTSALGTSIASDERRRTVPDPDLYAQVYAERFGEPPLTEYVLTDQDRLDEALEATQGERVRRYRNGQRLR